MSKLHELLRLAKHPGKEKIEQITLAYEFVEKLYGGQNLFSSGSHFNHIIGTAKILADIGMDRDTISAGMLYGTFQNKTVSKEKLKNQLGGETVFLVESVAKFDQIYFPETTRNIDSFVKFLLATTPDLRVLIIKLAERLDCLRNIRDLNRSEQMNIARKIMNFYVPLSECLGIVRIKQELETRAFQIINGKNYHYVSDLIRRCESRERKGLEEFKKSLLKAIAAERIRVLKSEIRLKSPYSIYKKLKLKGSIDRIYDIRALRIIVPSVADCYRVLGIVHTHWQPLPYRIKDYIALPKPDGYQSLHSTVFVGNGSIIEIQIRTPEMHARAQWGIVSHTHYKPAEQNPLHRLFRFFFPPPDQTESRNSEHYRKIPELIKRFVDMKSYLQGETNENDKTQLKFLSTRMFVFNNRGEVIDLPKDATVVDFAFLLETDRAPYMAGAHINGAFAPISTRLKNGDIVELYTKKNARPRPKWVRYAVTASVRNEINKYLKNEDLPVYRRI